MAFPRRPAPVTFEGVPLPADVDFLADVKPSRARTSPEPALALDPRKRGRRTQPRHGERRARARAARLLGRPLRQRRRLMRPVHHRVSFPATSTRRAVGADDFWYRPTYDQAAGDGRPSPRVCERLRGRGPLLPFEKAAGSGSDANGPWFGSTRGGALDLSDLSPPNYAWRANDWVHLMSSGTTGRPRPPSALREQPRAGRLNSGVDYNSATLTQRGAASAPRHWLPCPESPTTRRESWTSSHPGLATQHGYRLGLPTEFRPDLATRPAISP